MIPIASATDVMCFMLVHWLISYFRSGFRDCEQQALTTLFSNSDAERNAAGDKQGMMPDFC